MKPRLFTVTSNTISLSLKCHFSCNIPFGSIFSLRVQMWRSGGYDKQIVELIFKNIRKSHKTIFVTFILLISIQYFTTSVNFRYFQCYRTQGMKSRSKYQLSIFKFRPTSIRLSVVHQYQPLNYVSDAFSTDAQRLLKEKEYFLTCESFLSILRPF